MLDPVSAAAVRRAHAALNLITPPYDPGEEYFAPTIRAMLADNWGKTKTPQLERHRALCEQFGEPARARTVRIPWHALATRDLQAETISGAYLVPTDSGPFVDALRPRSVVLQLGARTFNAGPGNLTLPKGTNDVTAYWLADENSPLTESQPTFGQLSATPKILGALTEVSHQLLAQSNADVILRGLFQRGGATALDAGALNGPGSGGAPTGIIATNGIGAFSGTTLNRAALTNAQGDIALANAVVSGSTGYVTTPTVAGVLQNRADTIFSTRPVWDGSVHDGQIIGERALSTTGMPASSMLYGDWSNVTIVSWGTPQLAVDPFTKFNSGLVAIRLLFMVDVIVTNPAGFSLATSIT
jgi:HK97 family phage major capsid protein